MADSRNSTQEDVTPNLIPMIDIMFLLLLFLMIASDMGQRELEAVRLPVAEVGIPDLKDANDRLTLNVYHPAGSSICKAYDGGGICREDRHWRIGIKGADYIDMDKLLAVLNSEAAIGRKGTDPRAPNVSERKVMIRADAAAPFGLPQRAMNACSKAGMYMIDVGAAQSVETGKKRAHF